MKRVRVGKLVRDKIADLIDRSGDRSTTQILSKGEYVRELKRKAIEEAKEVSNAKTPTEIVTELADLKEVLSALSKVLGISEREITKIQRSRRTSRGGFEKRLYLESVTLADQSPWKSYYETGARPTRETNS
jgi:predicted house-cleaning noncanonical NTP pyrophosphatase (MazG superfamily)